VPTLSLTSFAERVDAGPIIARFTPTIVVEATSEDIRLPVEKRWNGIVKLLTSYGYAMYRFNHAGRLERTDQLSDPDPDVVFLPNLANAS
jgi:hypothetical protein